MLQLKSCGMQLYLIHGSMLNLSTCANFRTFYSIPEADPGVTNKLKKSFSQGNLFKTGHNSAARITLVYPKYVWRTATALFFFKKNSNK